MTDLKTIKATNHCDNDCAHCLIQDLCDYYYHNRGWLEKKDMAEIRLNGLKHKERKQ